MSSVIPFTSDRKLEVPPSVLRSFDLYRRVIESGNMDIISQIQLEDWEREPVPIRTFIEDEYYLG